MTLGAVVGTFIVKIGTGAGGFLPFAHQSVIPAWFVVVFLIFAVVQLFAINSLDMYSSGVTLQALGLPVKRYQAVLVDCVVALGVTMYAIFNSSFTDYLSDFVDVVIVWIAPWSAIFLVDWVLRRYRYVRASCRRPAGQPVLALRRHLLAGAHRPGGRDVRRHLGPLGDLPPSRLAQRGHVPHRGLATTSAPTSASSSAWPSAASSTWPWPSERAQGGRRAGRPAQGRRAAC